MASPARAVPSAPRRDASTPRPRPVRHAHSAGRARPASAPRRGAEHTARRQQATRRERRPALLLRGLGVLLVVGALGAAAAAHTMVASEQQQIDDLQGSVAQALVSQQTLQLQRAELEAPERVLHIAEHQLGMVLPPKVTYLSPVDPGPSVASSQQQQAALAILRAATPLPRRRRATEPAARPAARDRPRP